MTTTHDGDVPMNRPQPRRPFEIGSETPSSPESSTPDNASFPGKLDMSKAPNSGTSTPARTRSILNLTSSTLFGIYQPTGYGTDREDATPWGSVPQTPADSQRGSFDFTRSSRLPDSIEVSANGRYKRKDIHARKQIHKRNVRTKIIPLLMREAVLLATGVLYGLLVSHLHDKQQIAPVTIDIDRSSWGYLSIWAVAGLVFGETLPWLDSIWAHRNEGEEDSSEDKNESQRRKGLHSWNEVARSVGAFVGISFAIRKLPWESNLQLSLTLALANPALWYLIDRSPPGFILSSVVSIAGTTALLLSQPGLIPAPSAMPPVSTGSLNSTISGISRENLVFGMFSQEAVGVWTWIASVLFVSTVCFGNIGRQLTSRTT